MNVHNITNINRIIDISITYYITYQYTFPFNQVFFKFPTEKSFEVFLKRNGYGFISESLALI